MRLAFGSLLLALGALLSCGAAKSSDPLFRAASESLFQRRPFHSTCEARPRGAGYIITSNHLRFQRNQSRNLTFPLSEVPSLTLTADGSGMIYVAGSNRDNWLLNLCAQAEGNTESEALTQLGQVSMGRTGDSVSLANPARMRTPFSLNTLFVKAPAAAPLVAYGSFAAVQVQDMAGPLHVAAIHARATILDTAGTVDASGFVVDFAGSRGTVRLSSETEINLKLRAPRFDGSLMAWAQGPVRVLIPRSFQTPFQVVVNRRKDFACRADICSNITLQKQSSLCIFTYSGDGKPSPSDLHFRSELETVVIDNGK